jgi:prolyl oligopeptidase
MLYGYGGFSVTLSPSFSPSIQSWLEMGGVYAVANLRGGGEYGEDWHQAGTKLKKQNVFDDFIAAAEYLIREKYTNPKRLAILGRSNGGLLVGAALTQRPELFGAALPGVGVMDMLRYHTASANARQWSSDFGISENAEEFQALRAYSPVHNVKAGSCSATRRAPTPCSFASRLAPATVRASRCGCRSRTSPTSSASSRMRWACPPPLVRTSYLVKTSN